LALNNLTKQCLPKIAQLIVEITKDIQISKYIQHSLPCVIRSQTCPVHIVLLLLDIVPRAFSTCKILMYNVLRQVNQASK